MKHAQEAGDVADGLSKEALVHSEGYWSTTATATKKTDYFIYYATCKPLKGKHDFSKGGESVV